ncbi:MAG: Gfo/Idh/MocA family oxidoreductase [Bythopirellula sp.]|nr:Gfo/Idh/MocA family oxidoreductase [Bythopirellula sp.]
MNHPSRRKFLQDSALLSAAFAAPLLTGTKLFGQDKNSKPKIAAIGVGGSRGRYNQGGSIARKAAKFGDMIAVCDVDDFHTEEFNKDFNGKLAKYRDYRKLLETEKPDVVTIGTPDHWHVPIAIDALHAGCDVYCEKPLTLTIEQGFRIREAVKETGRVFQVGTQQRSEHDLLFLKAIAIVQSGKLGDNVKTHIAIGDSLDGGPFKTTPVPEGLDWNMWVGPTPQRDFSEERRKEFRWFYEYSGGQITDWGAHHIDIAQWALGLGHTGPVAVHARGKFPAFVPSGFNWKEFLDGKIALPNAYTTVTRFDIDLKYANGATITVANEYEQGKTKFGNGILFEGSQGRIFVNRGRITGKLIEDMTAAERSDLYQSLIPVYKGRWPGDHMGNFFECVADRGEPISDVETHHRTMTTCHLCNISLMLGSEVKWNPDTERFINDPAADALISRASRPGFTM